MLRAGMPDRPARRRARRTAAIAASLLRSRDARMTKPESDPADRNIGACRDSCERDSRPRSLAAMFRTWLMATAKAIIFMLPGFRISPDHVRRCLRETGTGGCASSAAAAETQNPYCLKLRIFFRRGRRRVDVSQSVSVPDRERPPNRPAAGLAACGAALTLLTRWRTTFRLPLPNLVPTHDQRSLTAARPVDLAAAIAQFERAHWRQASRAWVLLCRRQGCPGSECRSGVSAERRTSLALGTEPSRSADGVYEEQRQSLGEPLLGSRPVLCITNGRGVVGFRLLRARGKIEPSASAAAAVGRKMALESRNSDFRDRKRGRADLLPGGASQDQEDRRRNGR